MVNTEFVKARRIKLKLTQEQAALLAGMKLSQQWSRIENGETANPRADTLAAIAKALQCKVDSLLAKA
jgi:transcriptional regulator with XRE-family HTH domain